jgi:hypothetical protein
MTNKHEPLGFRKPVERADGTYLVTDLFLAAFLAVRGNKILGLQSTSQATRCEFLIEPRERFAQDLTDFEWNGMLGIRDFELSFQTIKRKLRDHEALRSTSKKQVSRY